MAETIKTGRPYFIATRKDELGSSFSDLERTVQDVSYGNVFKKAVLAYDFDIDGAVAVSDGTVNLRLDGTSTEFTLPANAQIVNAFYKVTTTFTSATDAAALSLGIPTDDAEGIVAEALISAATDWDATTKVTACIQVGTAATASEATTAERNIVLKNGDASEATTAGALKLYIEYIEV